MKYAATLGIYVNCHISGTREIEFDAKDYAEAETVASRRAEELEAEVSREYDLPLADIWVAVEDIYGGR